jgi:hypothetical protein
MPNLPKDPKKDIRYPADLTIPIYVTISLVKARSRLIGLSIWWPNGLMQFTIPDLINRSLKCENIGRLPPAGLATNYYKIGRLYLARNNDDLGAQGM